MKALSVILLSLCLVFAGCAMPGMASERPSSEIEVAVGAGGMIARSLDHGQTWETVMGFKSQVFKKTNVTVDGNLKVNGELNGARFAQIDSLASVVSQMQGNFQNGFSGDLHARGTFYQKLGQKWVGPIANPFGGSSLNRVAFGASTYVAGGQGGKLGYSLDYGATWTLAASPFGGGDSVTGIIFGSGQFVAITLAGNTSTSPDGITWSAQQATTLDDARAIAYGNGSYIACGQQLTGSLPAIIYSKNGTSWTAVPLPSGLAGTTVLSIAFGNGVFVTEVNTGGGYLFPISLDLGLSWTNKTNPLTGSLQGIGFGNGIFIAVTSSGAIGVSQNYGQSWTSLGTPLGAVSLGTVWYTFGIFQVAGAVGVIGRSYDNAVTWSLVTNPFGANNIYSIASSPSNMVAVGAAGSIATAGWNAAYSLQEPVPGEPSLGTPHFRTKQSIIAVINGAVCVAGTWQTATFTGLPAGVKALWVNCLVFASGASGAIGLYWRPYNNGDTVLQSLHRGVTWAPIAGAYGEAGAMVVPDSSGRVDFGPGQGGVGSALYVYDWAFYWI